MRKTLLLLVVSAAAIGLLFIPKRIVVAPDTANPVVIQQDNKKEKTIEELIYDAAVRYNIDHDRFLATAKCESSLRPTVIGDDGNSIGLFQIHLPSHPDVLMENALNPEWAIDWAAKKFKVDPTIWVCYNKLYK